ncbi:MAG: transposase [Spirochaetales bacterium]|nr:transposase [Spirochaetales bacterium]
MLRINDLLRESENDKKRVGKAVWGNIDKTGFFYHVITKSWNGDKIFNKEIADYRHNLLCILCGDAGITILFSVTMPNHTHDVFLAPSWEVLSEVIRVLNSRVSIMIRKLLGNRISKDRPVFSKSPAYVVLRDPVAVMCEGKYVFDNPAYLRAEKQFVPHSCFWMFEKNHFVFPYDEKLYQKLFGMSGDEIFALYSQKNPQEVREFAQTKFSNWTREMIESVFYRREAG